MTTIVYSKAEKVLVADGRITQGHRIAGENFEKVRKFESVDFGSVFIACAGNVTHILEVFNFIELIFDGYEPDGIKFDSETLELLMMTENGDLYEGLLTESSTNINWLPLNDEYTTIGSGSDFALGALEAGSNAINAVLVASRRDVFTNDNIKVYDSKELSYRQSLENRLNDIRSEYQIIEEEIKNIDSEIENQINSREHEGIIKHPLQYKYEDIPDEESNK